MGGANLYFCKTVFGSLLLPCGGDADLKPAADVGTGDKFSELPRTETKHEV